MPKKMARVKWLVPMAEPDRARPAESEMIVDLEEAQSCAAKGFCEILEELKPPKKERAVK